MLKTLKLQITDLNSSTVEDRDEGHQGARLLPDFASAGIGQLPGNTTLLFWGQATRSLKDLRSVSEPDTFQERIPAANHP